ncbi:hypothetical protein [Duffyella gerundensis]|uniref:hypothetical protein n=1 Tax=Duffyella TaxID=3026546 RepID=UPI003F6DCEBC
MNRNRCFQTGKTAQKAALLLIFQPTSQQDVNGITRQIASRETGNEGEWARLRTGEQNVEKRERQRTARIG